MPMNRQYIEEHDVIRRYLLGRLTEDELAGFETCILEDADLITAIETERVMMQAFRDNAAMLNKAEAETPGGAWYRHGTALAASLAIAILIVLSLPDEPAEFELQQPIRLESFRGAEDNAVSASGQPIVQFQVDVGPPDILPVNAFSLEIVDLSTGMIIDGAEGLSADADGWLFYAMNGQTAPLSGLHEVRVTADGAGQATSTYTVDFSLP